MGILLPLLGQDPQDILIAFDLNKLTFQESTRLLLASCDLQALHVWMTRLLELDDAKYNANGFKVGEHIARHAKLPPQQRDDVEDDGQKRNAE